MREERYLSRPVLSLCRALMRAGPRTWLGYFVEDGPGAKVGHVDWQTGHVREYRLVGYHLTGDRTYLELESSSGGRVLVEPTECVPAQVLCQDRAVERALCVPRVFDRAVAALEGASKRGAKLVSLVHGRLVALGRRAEAAFWEWLSRGAEVVRAAGEAGKDAVVASVRSAGRKTVRVAASGAVGVARAARVALETAAARAGSLEERWSVWLREVPVGSELGAGPLSEKVGVRAVAAVIERDDRVLAPREGGFREVSEAALDAQGPVVGCLSREGLYCGQSPVARGVSAERGADLGY